jgi:hypothetical protein
MQKVKLDFELAVMTYFMMLFRAATYDYVMMGIFFPVTLVSFVFYLTWRYGIYPKKTNPMSHKSLEEVLGEIIKENKADVNYC